MRSASFGQFADGHRVSQLAQRDGLRRGEPEDDRALPYMLADLLGQPGYQPAQLPLGGRLRLVGRHPLSIATCINLVYFKLA
jgi:hypothetical protein